jgi:hypothetical protein
MKYYVRQIKPYIKFDIPGVALGCAVDGYDWVPEDMEAELRRCIKPDEPLAILTFKERYVEVEL